MENENLNLEQVARGMTPKFDKEEGETMLKTSVHVRLALNRAGKALSWQIYNDHGQEETIATLIIERIATTRQQPGKPTHKADDVAATLAQIEAMPEAHKRYLSIASYVCRSAPASEREDFQQEVYLELVTEAPKDIRLAWAIAHRTAIDCFRNWRRYRGHVEPMSSPAPYALDASDPYVEHTLGDLASEIGYLDEEYDYVEARIDAKRLWESLNAGKRIKAILDKRLHGEALATRDRVYLHRWLASHQDEIAAVM